MGFFSLQSDRFGPNGVGILTSKDGKTVRYGNWIDSKFVKGVIVNDGKYEFVGF